MHISVSMNLTIASRCGACVMATLIAGRAMMRRLVMSLSVQGSYSAGNPTSVCLRGKCVMASCTAYRIKKMSCTVSHVRQASTVMVWLLTVMIQLHLPICHHYSRL